MPEAMLDKLIDLAPQLGFLVLFIVALGMLLREYRILRTEMRQSVDDAVNARLGSMLGDLQIENAKVAKMMADISSSYEQVQASTVTFEEELRSRSTQLNQSLMDIEEKLSILHQAVPQEGIGKYPARDFNALANRASTLAEVLDLLANVQNDPDATSKDLEMAGDIARKKARRFSLAIELYERAVGLDPENISATAELLALRAELDAAGREKHLEQLFKLVMDTLNLTALRRAANALIELDRYSDLDKLCRQVLECELDPNSPVLVQAHRDLAVALQAQRRFPEAREEYESAFSVAPDDENLIKAYIHLLRELKEYPRALVLSRKLVTLDPTDLTYYLIAAETCILVERYQEALRWFERAEQFAATQPEQIAVAAGRQKAMLLIELQQDGLEAPEAEAMHPDQAQ